MVKNLIFKIRYLFRYGTNCNIESSIVSSDVKLQRCVNITCSKIAGNVRIGEYSSIADNTQILSKFCKILIGKRVSIAPNVLIQNYSHNLDYRITNNNALKRRVGEKKFLEIQRKTSNDIVIGDDVWIGINSIIMPGVKIGNCSVVGANSLVNKSIGENEIWAGSPARLISKREYIDIF